MYCWQHFYRQIECESRIKAIDMWKDMCLFYYSEIEDKKETTKLNDLHMSNRRVCACVCFVVISFFFFFSFLILRFVKCQMFWPTIFIYFIIMSITMWTLALRPLSIRFWIMNANRCAKYLEIWFNLQLFCGHSFGCYGLPSHWNWR